MPHNHDNPEYNGLDEPHQDIYFIGIALPSDLDQRLADLKWRLYHAKSQMLKPVLPHILLL